MTRAAGPGLLPEPAARTRSGPGRPQDLRARWRHRAAAAGPGMLDWPPGGSGCPRGQPALVLTGRSEPVPAWRITDLITTEQVLLADYTTLRLGGPAARFAVAGSADELIAAVADRGRRRRAGTRARRREQSG